jgi:hypothetical protein
VYFGTIGNAGHLAVRTTGLRDVVSGFGPETINDRDQVVLQSGTYRLYVHNYSGDGAWQ